MKPSLALLILTLTQLPAMAAAVENRTFTPPGGAILDALEIERSDCDADQTSRYAGHIAVECGTTEETLKSIRKAWRKAVRRGPLSESVRWDGAPWRSTTDSEKTMYAKMDGMALAVSIDFADGKVSVRWPETFPGCHEGREVVWFSQTDDVVGHTTRNRIHPEYPVEARVQRTGGVVMGSFVVEKNGRVGEVCVTGVYPPGLGFERAAVDALKRSTFEPATRDGEPVVLAAPFSTEFTIMPDGSYASSPVQAFFEAARTDGR